MKKQNNLCWQSSLLVAVFLLGAFTTAFAQGKAGNGIGADYGSRDPRACKDAKNPSHGAPSAEQAKQYAICGLEHVEGAYLYLVEDITVEVGKGRSYSALSEPFASDIDTKSPVYPIRASFKQYQCGHEHKDPSSPIYNLGKNCSISPEPKAEGKCYKTSFGDWSCSITSRTSDYKTTIRDVAPPKGPASEAKPAVIPATNTPGAINGKLNELPAANTVQADNDYPMPDTTEWEKYYDVVKYEYDIIAGKLNFVVKPKKASRPSAWMINFYDADGVRVIGENGITGMSIFTEVGQPEKAYAYTPSEKTMAKVKRVVVTRVIN